MKKIIGKGLHKITEGISFILDLIINIVNFVVTVVATLSSGLAALIGAGGCLFIFLLGPFGLYFLLNPATLLLVLFFVVFPILGTKFVSWLKYLKYIFTEYLFDLSDDLIKGRNRKKRFNEYGLKYRRMQEEQRRREQQRRREEEQRQWEERFRQWNEYQKSQQQYYGGYWGSGQYTGYGGQTYVNPTTDFVSKYEKSCQILGLGTDADKYQIKLAYRKKAKEYHPDINKAPDATTKFQVINDAYEFLNDANIERYKNINK
ncbi:MAG: DnaJ domain-containing protein [Tissierellia bacterium]|nr:DnaJ domain-containing protein [Tissierellia bacterium]